MTEQQAPTFAETYALGLLAEECGEVLQLVGKALRFGIDTPGRLGSDGKVSGETPRTLLPAEVGDLLAAVAFAIEHDMIDRREVYEAKARKLAKLLNPRAIDNLGRQLAPQPERAPGLFEAARHPFVEAQAIADDPRVLGVYAAPEWDDLDDNGKAWLAAIVEIARPDGGGQRCRVAAAPPPPAPPRDQARTKEVRSLLSAILHYTEAFYGAAIKHGLGANFAADAVQHVERAARRLAALSGQPSPPPAPVALVEAVRAYREAVVALLGYIPHYTVAQPYREREFALRETLTAAQRALDAALSAQAGAPAGVGQNTVRERDAWKAMVGNYGAALAMVRETVETFGPIASLESREASLLRGPEAVHEAEGIVEAMLRVRARLAAQSGGNAPTEADLKRFGWAPGSYEFICQHCGLAWEGDKRATCCEACALKRWNAAQSGVSPAGVGHSRSEGPWLLRGQGDDGPESVSYLDPDGWTDDIGEATGWPTRMAADGMRAECRLEGISVEVVWAEEERARLATPNGSDQPGDAADMVRDAATEGDRG